MAEERAKVAKELLIEVKKNLSMPESGIHVHALERENRSTKKDGAHRHIFILPNGIVLVTEEDGEHSHELWDETSNVSDGWDSDHQHKILLPDGGALMTGPGEGWHGHELQMEHSAFDGIHVHTLRTPNNVEISSLTPGEMWNLMGRPEQADLPSAPPASQVVPRSVDGEEMEAIERHVKIIKIEDEDEDEDKRLVLGIVYEPDTEDAHGDFATAETIERMAHKFLREYNRSTKMGLQHKQFGNIGVELVESYVTPVDLTLGEQQVQKGTWVINSHVVDDGVWADIKSGAITGYSFGGIATVEAEE